MLDLPVDVAKVLSDCPREKSFWFCTGSVAHNLREFIDTIEALSAHNFTYHCNAGHNDFSKWIREVIDDPYLADDIEGVINQKRVVEILRKGLEEREKEEIRQAKVLE